MKICFTGDMFLGGDLLDLALTRSIKVKSFKEADYRVVNLEQAVSDNSYTANKGTLYTGSSTIESLKDVKVSAVNLAHNHIQDKGLDGISETIDHLRHASIGTFGVGVNRLDAKKFHLLTDEIALFGYCEYGKSYLNQIIVADDNTPGINSLRYDNIMDDLNSLPLGCKAILYFHWGREHVYLPPFGDIDLARKLLKDDRVLTIVGMHAHRMQGYVGYKGKRAYMCLGNFLFPNFYIDPPTQIYYPKNDEDTSSFPVTRQYHRVFKKTYKKWRLANRVSIVLEYDTLTNRVSHKFVKQRDSEPIVEDLGRFQSLYYRVFVNWLSFLYTLPNGLYKAWESLNTKAVYFIWKNQIIIRLIRQLGVKKTIKSVVRKIKKRIDKI